MLHPTYANRLLRATFALAVLVCLSFATVSAAQSYGIWLKVNPPNAPPARAAMAMAYDEAGKKTVVFGGFDATSYRNDTWIFDGTTWSQVVPPTSPSPRAASAMAFDRVTGKLVMFGGYDGTQDLGDTWIWDGLSETWTQANPATKPTPVTLPMMFIDPKNGHAGMFGGFDGTFYQGITWQWTGSDWRNMHPATSPTARGAAIISNDFSHRTVVLYGGLADVNPINTWTWDGSTWTLQNPSTQPDSLYYAAAAYDPDIHRVVMFGGDSGLSTTWIWTGADWISAPALNAPAGRESEGMAYDKDSHQFLLFGGQAGNLVLDGFYQLVKK
jgi:hypothetical protein